MSIWGSFIRVGFFFPIVVCIVAKATLAPFPRRDTSTSFRIVIAISKRHSLYLRVALVHDVSYIDAIEDILKCVNSNCLHSTRVHSTRDGRTRDGIEGI